MDDETECDADELLRQQVQWAQSMSAEEKLRLGPMLFDLLCGILTDGIHREHPQADAAEVNQILRERLDLIDLVENGGVPRESVVRTGEQSNRSPTGSTLSDLQ